MKKLIIIFSIFLLIDFSINSYDLSKSINELNKLDEKYVIYVYDGDTFKLSSGETVRLVGIDTPEMNHNSNEKKEIFAEKAKKFTSNNLKNKKIYLEYGRKKYDKYNRLLAYVYKRSGEIFNLTLLEKGLADLLFIPPNEKYSKTFYEAAKTAHKDEKGKWKIFNQKFWDKSVKRIDHTETGKFINKKVIVEGKIVNTHDTGKIIFLDFSKNYQKSFSIVIYKRPRFMFPFDPCEYFLNKNIAVSGKIIRYENKYEIIVKNPFQIKIK
ncbi:MAG: nuclease [Candidatus Mcinerneyibacterium aminivorans]|uniref:Nuclease n=1 Tax=Candidatus Mcinerneyibacterium aminivorans TaxID=2703815 RepID=A0A5D0MH21_9BACT|nr:MAG: nuclease [Candidatus Mcinerneyibacterium aminivorans]